MFGNQNTVLQTYIMVEKENMSSHIFKVFMISWWIRYELKETQSSEIYSNNITAGNINVKKLPGCYVLRNLPHKVSQFYFKVWVKHFGWYTIKLTNLLICKIHLHSRITKKKYELGAVLAPEEYAEVSSEPDLFAKESAFHCDWGQKLSYEE